MSWETYERLLAEHNPGRGKRLTYDNGVLHIVVLSARHEYPNRILDTIVSELASAWDLDIAPTGGMTVKRPDLRKGFEPDTSFYFRDPGRIREMREMDFTVDPPPDLVIEVDITSQSIDKFPIFAATGVREVWRLHEGAVSVLVLGDGRYVESQSLLLPPVTGADLTRFLDGSRRQTRPQWIAAIRAWAKSARP